MFITLEEAKAQVVRGGRNRSAAGICGPGRHRHSGTYRYGTWAPDLGVLQNQTHPRLPRLNYCYSKPPAQHEKVIRPALALGTMVICDRFADSSLAYQDTAGSGARPGGGLNHAVTGGLRVTTLLLDVPVEID
jgi:hypothetical protein